MAAAKLQPAFVGGVAIGVLSALPIIQLANCCCGWILFGGALAAYLTQQNHPEPMQIGDGAIAGLLAGIFGAVIWLFVSIPIDLMMAPLQSEMSQRMLENMKDLTPELRSVFEQMRSGPVIGFGKVLWFFAMLVLGSVFGMFGGLFGALLFRKSSPVIPPIPPQSF